MTYTKTIQNRKITIKAQMLYTVGAIICAVALPQLLHIIGAVSGLGSALGETFLPMHLPIILVGLLAGPLAGGVAGALAPIISFILAGMPTSAMLPFMVIELAIYGVSSGLLAGTKMPCTLKVLCSQFSGRAIRAIAILISFYAFNNTAIAPAIILKSILTGLPGIILQLILLPLIMFKVNSKGTKSNEQ